MSKILIYSNYTYKDGKIFAEGNRKRVDAENHLITTFKMTYENGKYVELPADTKELLTIDFFDYYLKNLRLLFDEDEFQNDEQRIEYFLAVCKETGMICKEPYKEDFGDFVLTEGELDLHWAVEESERFYELDKYFTYMNDNKKFSKSNKERLLELMNECMHNVRAVQTLKNNDIEVNYEPLNAFGVGVIRIMNMFLNETGIYTCEVCGERREMKVKKRHVCSSCLNNLKQRRFQIRKGYKKGMTIEEVKRDHPSYEIELITQVFEEETNKRDC